MVLLEDLENQEILSVDVSKLKCNWVDYFLDELRNLILDHIYETNDFAQLYEDYYNQVNENIHEFDYDNLYDLIAETVYQVIKQDIYENLNDSNEILMEWARKVLLFNLKNDNITMEDIIDYDFSLSDECIDTFNDFKKEFNK